MVRINIPPSVVEIYDEAFYECGRLEEVDLNEGLQHIGGEAFQDCTSLIRISIPSTTVNVGGCAFANCHQLRNVVLHEGLQAIGAEAFVGCRALERIAIPSSVTFIGDQAFRGCCTLSEVTLREGLHDIEVGAFEDCTALAQIIIPPVALVINIRDSHCQFMRATMPAPRNITLVVSKWMQCRSPGQLAHAEAKVNEILGRHQQTEEEKIQCIRKWFAYYDRLDVTTLLELAIWRANMDGNGHDAEAMQRNPRMRRRRRGERDASRRNCGADMNIIIPAVLEYLEK